MRCVVLLPGSIEVITGAPFFRGCAYMNAQSATTGCSCVIEQLEPRLQLAGSPGERLTKTDVDRILALAASQALSTQVIAVVDRDGEILGVLAMREAKTAGARDQTGDANPLLGTMVKAITRARTGAFFESRDNAFTTRTARFIIQDNFPFPVPNTPGGPLYGVEFSSLPGSDFAKNSLNNAGPAISGDPGGIPLFKNGEPVGGIGVAGDGRDFLLRSDFFYDPTVTNPADIFNGQEENDVDEKVALAGAVRNMAPFDVQSERILLDGLRLPFTEDSPATGGAARTLANLLASGDARLINPDQTCGFAIGRDGSKTRSSPAQTYPIVGYPGIPGQLKNQRTKNDPGNEFGIVPGDDASPENLTVSDVKKIFTNATQQALDTRAAIREPLGLPAKVHIAVVDRDGDVLGVFRMDDGTIFSYDVAVQKARTAAYFSNDRIAFSTRAVGFVAQRYFPAGINQGTGGMLFQVQNALSLGGNLGFDNRAELVSGSTKNPLRNGITIFPGGIPLYKNNVLVGAIGISGDGVDQDDIIAYAGTKGFRPTGKVRADSASEERIVNRLADRVSFLFDNFDLSTPLFPVDESSVLDRLAAGLDDVQLPYVKFPRNPEI